MKTAPEFLDDIKAKTGVKSDYAVARILGTRHTNISHYRNGRSHFSGTMAIKVAQVLGIEPAYVMACMESERTKEPEVKKVWEHAAKILKKPCPDKE